MARTRPAAARPQRVPAERPEREAPQEPGGLLEACRIRRHGGMHLGADPLRERGLAVEPVEVGLELSDEPVVAGHAVPAVDFEARLGLDLGTQRFEGVVEPGANGAHGRAHDLRRLGR